MSAIDMAAIMDAITATLTTGGRDETMYPYPTENAEPPCVIVGYPENIEYDATFGEGSDKATFPVWFVVSRGDPQTARDDLSAIVAGAGTIKALLDGTLGGEVQTARVVDAQPAFIDIAGTPYAAVKFSVEVYT